MKTKLLIFLICFIALVDKTVATSPPLGESTGLMEGICLGLLEDESVAIKEIGHTTPGNGRIADFATPNEFLDTQKFTLYVPEDYNPNEKYGLICYIDARTIPRMREGFLEAIKEKKIICLALYEYSFSTSLASVWAGAQRIQELYNIDTERIYSGGRSAGSRISSILPYILPDKVKGHLGIVGTGYHNQFEGSFTDQLSSSASVYANVYRSYFGLADVQPNYFESLSIRNSIITFYEDTRELFLMDTYYSAYEKDGIEGRCFIYPGEHTDIISKSQYLEAISCLLYTSPSPRDA